MTQPADAVRPEPPPLADRACGACNVCCVSLTIDDPDLRKPQGYRCRNAQPDNGCAIYHSRPHTCRTFYCGWRMLKWVRAPLRPDVSGVLIRLHVATAGDGTPQAGIIVTLLTRAGLKAEGLAETVAAAVAGGVVVFLEVPGPPGFTYGRAKMNDALSYAVHAKDKPGILDILRWAYGEGRHGKRRPVTLSAPKSQPPTS